MIITKEIRKLRHAEIQGLRPKRRNSPYIFQVVASLKTYTGTGSSRNP
jgi:hypothetical protein